MAREERAVVAEILSEKAGRLEDMGLAKGAAVRCLFKSPFGGISAYFVRGAVIALRLEDSGRIIVTSSP